MLRGALLLMILASAASAQDAPMPQLQRDPFARPDLSKQADAPRSNATVAVAPSWNPVLRAILLAGPNSLVNINGELVAIDQEIQGHRLVEVNENSAVFIHGGVQKIVSLKESE